MAIARTNFMGEGCLGLFGFASDAYCILSNRVTETKAEDLSEKLDVPVLQTTVSAFMLPGIMSAGNSNAILLPYLSEDSEIVAIGKIVPKVQIVSDKFTALGNLVCANDNGGIISDVFSDKAKKMIDDALGFKTERGRIADSSEVGSICIATNKGFVVTPDAADKELDYLKEIFGVSGGRASLDMGKKSVGSHLIANSKGMVISEKTTPIEIEYANDALGFL